MIRVFQLTNRIILLMVVTVLNACQSPPSVLATRSANGSLSDEEYRDFASGLQSIRQISVERCRLEYMRQELQPGQGDAGMLKLTPEQYGDQKRDEAFRRLVEALSQQIDAERQNLRKAVNELRQ